MGGGGVWVIGHCRYLFIYFYLFVFYLFIFIFIFFIFFIFFEGVGSLPKLTILFWVYQNSRNFQGIVRIGIRTFY